MIILDANLLIYAYMPQMKQHKAAAAWLEAELSKGSEAVGITWGVTAAFVRLTTNNRIFDPALPVSTATGYLDDLFSHPLTRKAAPSERHWEIFSEILVEHDLTGDIVMDAHLAAIAIGNKAKIASTDRHFRRFADRVKIIDPLSK